ELLTYRYIIEDDELDIRFAKFEEWLDEIESVTIKNKGYGTMRHFKEILHLEENITKEENREKVKKFQKSITYQWWDGNKYLRPWINDDLTDRIIEKIVETKSFVEEYSDVGELESSDDIGESNSDEGDEHTNNKFWRKICRSCSEREEEDIDGIDKRIRELKKICDEMKIIVTEGELLRLTSMGYTDGQILDEEFIEIFQENKNELERELRKKLDKLLREQAGIINEGSDEEGDNEESEEDNIDESEKIGEILSPEEYEMWNENDEGFNENEFGNENENVINTGGFDLSQNSDLNNSLNIKNSDIENSDNESELSDYNLQDLFQENI
ncbi:hypothetical protein RhiirA4_484547, partial [Rhizophagus irregularis]